MKAAAAALCVLSLEDWNIYLLTFFTWVAHIVAEFHEMW